MEIWILDHYAGAGDQQATLAYDLGRELVARGDPVTVFSSSFNHYLRRYDRCAGRGPWCVEDHEGVRFVWLRTFPYRTNDWRRLLNMLSYTMLALIRGAVLRPRPDVIIGTCVHPFAPAAAYVLARMMGSRFVYHVTDPWPQILVDMGMLREEELATRALRALERYLFVRAEQILSAWPHFGEYVQRLGLRKRIVYIPNGGDLSRYRGIPSYRGGDGGPFDLFYLGGHAPYHGLEVVLQAAKILQDRGLDGIRFRFVGDGVAKPGLIELARRLRLRAVEFRDMVPRDRLGSVLGEADALIYVLRDLPTMRYGTSPTKLVDYLASGRPIVYAARARNDPVAEAGAGITVEPERPEALADAIRRLVEMDAAQRIEMGRRGAEYARANYDARVLADRLEHALLDPPSG